jgi:signal transduction histidine kinase
MERRADPPVIMAYGSGDRRRQMHEYGAAEFVTKSVDFDGRRESRDMSISPSAAALQRRIDALERQLADANTEAREALEQHKASAEILSVISSSGADTQPVFDKILESCKRLFGGDEIGVLLVDEQGQISIRAYLGNSYDVVAPTFPAPVERTPAGRAISERRVVHWPDLVDGKDVPGIMRKMAKLIGYRSVVFAPMLWEGHGIGAIGVGRSTGPFQPRELATLQTFADQAVIAIQNVRLFTELREALAQQSATMEVLQVINASPGDLAPVVDAILERALQLCGTRFGGLGTWRDDRFEFIATRGLPQGITDFLAANQVSPGSRRGFARLAGGAGYVEFADLSQSKQYREGDPLTRVTVDLGGARTLLTVPLAKEDEALGVLIFYRQEVRPFSGRQIALVRSFAVQAVIAMENARLLGELTRRQEELRVTFDHMGDGVAMFDANLRLASWNRNFQELLDVPDSFLATRPALDAYIRLLVERGEFGAVDLATALKSHRADVSQQWSTERTRPDGRVIGVRNNPVPGGGAVLIYSDITERKKAEAEISAARDAAEAALDKLEAAQANLVQSEKMASLGQLTAGIAHEIKNPLNFVNNFAGLSVELLDELKEVAGPALAELDEAKRAELDETMTLLTGNLQKITEHGRRADGIVKSMLSHSRGGAGVWQPSDINGLVEEALNLAYHGARAQDNEFNVTLERDLGKLGTPIDVVPQDVTRVFLNLFGNGFYAVNQRRVGAGETGFRPTIRVATRDTGDGVEIKVRDNGIGIPPEVREKLFQPFFTTKPTGEGTGLGLSISYDIVTQQHGGTIAVESEPGCFSEFTVRLPRSRRVARSQ